MAGERISNLISGDAVDYKKQECITVMPNKRYTAFQAKVKLFVETLTGIVIADEGDWILIDRDGCPEVRQDLSGYDEVK